MKPKPLSSSYQATVPSAPSAVAGRGGWAGPRSQRDHVPGLRAALAFDDQEGHPC